jgi:hypothetical protein
MELGIDTSIAKFNSRCEACTFLYRPLFGNLTISDLIKQNTSVEYYPNGFKLSEIHNTILDKEFHVKYFCTAEPMDIKTKHIPISPSISVNNISKENQEDMSLFESFTLKTFYDSYKNWYGQQDREYFSNTVPMYFKENLFGKKYFKGNICVALVVTHLYDKHPAINEPTLHIGYWGYDRGLLTREEAQSIKNDWFIFLKEQSSKLGNIKIDASLDWFNMPAQKMSLFNGFKISALRLDSDEEIN